MRCQACDGDLTDFECSIRGGSSGNYLDMCSRCLSYIREVVNTTENFLLYDSKSDALDTQFVGFDDVALSEFLVEDDSAAAVDPDGVRSTDGGGGERLEN